MKPITEILAMGEQERKDAVLLVHGWVKEHFPEREATPLDYGTAMDVWKRPDGKYVQDWQIPDYLHDPNSMRPLLVKMTEDHKHFFIQSLVTQLPINPRSIHLYSCVEIFAMLIADPEIINACYLSVML